MSISYSWEGKGRYGSFRLRKMWECRGLVGLPIGGCGGPIETQFSTTSVSVPNFVALGQTVGSPLILTELALGAR